MKSLIAAICLSTVWLCGCTSTNWKQWLGGQTVNLTICTTEDLEKNRLEVAQITRLVADHYGLLDETGRERAHLESQPVQLEGYYLVAKYRGKGSKPIAMRAYAWQGKLMVSLSQSKWRKGRTSTYVQIQEALTTEFRTRFGRGSSIQLYDEGPE